jgi:hypothetical protein
MTDIPEPGRQAARIMLDAVTAYDVDGPEGARMEPLNLAFRRLNEVGAVNQGHSRRLVFGP